MSEPKNKGGRPPKLSPDEDTLKVVRGLGAIQATSRECAAVLGVSEPTWITVKKRHPEIEQAFDDGRCEGLVSLRRRQFKLAETNTAMAIWLGKIYLGQRDPGVVPAEGYTVTPPRLGKKELQRQDALTAGDDSDWGSDLDPPAAAVN